MSKLDVTLNVEKQVINLVDESGVQVGLEPQPKIAVTMIESGGGGGGSMDMDLTRKMYSARFEQNSDGDNTWTMVMPVVSGVIMNEDDTVTIQM